MVKKQESMSLEIRYAGGTDRGKKRENNEDYYLINNNLFVVADGLGGHVAGEKASQIAVVAVNDFFSEIKISSKSNMVNLMKSAFKEANKAVLAAVNIDPDLYGMRTTLIVAFLNNQVLHIAHVGDVRAYLIRNKEIKQLSVDHSVAAELVKHGHLPANELRSHPLRNRLTQTIGHDERDNPDYNTVVLQGGDCVILCSDGLWDMLPDEEVKEIIYKNPEAQTNVSTLIARANDAGGNDNITAVVIRILQFND
jgi:protein phosphatase